jgi:methyl-accepting chemotaxis protein
MQKTHYTKPEKGSTVTANAIDATLWAKAATLSPQTQLNSNVQPRTPAMQLATSREDCQARKRRRTIRRRNNTPWLPHGSLCTMFLYWYWGCFVGDISGVAYDAVKMAVEHVLSKIREGKKLSTEDVLILYLGTIVGDLRELKADIARLDDKIDKTNQRIDDIVKTLSARIDDVVKSLSARIDETNRRIDETNKRIDDLAKRIDAVQTTLLEIQKLLIELVKSRQ